MAKPSPVKLSADRKNYLCAKDDAVLPDGVIVQAAYSSNTLVGVRALLVGARSADGKSSAISVAHTCGTITGLSGKWTGQTDG